MTRSRGPRYAALALVLFGMACGEAATAPNGREETRVVVSLAGVSEEHAGVVLHLTGAVIDVVAGDPSLEVAWAADGGNAASVVIVGSLAQSSDLLVIRRPGGLDPLRAVVREVAAVDGTLWSPASIAAIVREGATP